MEGKKSDLKLLDGEYLKAYFCYSREHICHEHTHSYHGSVEISDCWNSFLSWCIPLSHVSSCHKQTHVHNNLLLMKTEEMSLFRRNVILVLMTATTKHAVSLAFMMYSTLGEWGSCSHDSFCSSVNAQLYRVCKAKPYIGYMYIVDVYMLHIHMQTPLYPFVQYENVSKFLFWWRKLVY